MVAAEGMFTGQYISCGTKAPLSVGNVLPIGKMPEGTLICNLEHMAGNRGTLVKASGCYATVVGQSEDGKKQNKITIRGKKQLIKSKSYGWCCWCWRSY